VAVIFTIPSLILWLVGLNVVLVGVALVPILPLTVALASKQTYPIDPATTQGVLFMSSMGTGCILAIFGTFLCQADPRYLMGLFAVLSVISLILSFFIPDVSQKAGGDKVIEEHMSQAVWGARLSVSVRSED
jgi:hypothetical protein